MNRLTAILLIPFFAVGNAFAHSHNGAAHQSHSQTRAHIHVSGGVHHDHDDHHSHGHSHHSHHHDHQHHDLDGNKPESTPVTPTEHDSDAVYLVAADFSFTTSERRTLELESQYFQGTAACIVSVANRMPNRIGPPFFRTPELPLYLLHAALRL